MLGAISPQMGACLAEVEQQSAADEKALADCISEAARAQEPMGQIRGGLQSAHRVAERPVLGRHRPKQPCSILRPPLGDTCVFVVI